MPVTKEQVEQEVIYPAFEFTAQQVQRAKTVVKEEIHDMTDFDRAERFRQEEERRKERAEERRRQKQREAEEKAEQEEIKILKER